MAQRVAMPSMAFSRSGNDTSQKTGPKPKAFKPKRQQTTQPPTDTGRGRGGRGRGAGRGGRGKGKNGKDPNFMSLRAAKKDVFDFGATGLSRRQQKIRENEKMVAFGAKAEKAQKMPLKMLLGIRRAEDRREKKLLSSKPPYNAILRKRNLLQQNLVQHPTKLENPTKSYSTKNSHSRRYKQSYGDSRHFE